MPASTAGSNGSPAPRRYSDRATGGKDETRPALIHAAEECRGWVEEKLRLPLSFGLGSTVTGLHEIGASYRSASEALGHRLVMGIMVSWLAMSCPRRI